MSKRKYTHIAEPEGRIQAMREGGATRQEIADHLGLTKKEVKDWITRYNRRQAKLKAGILPQAKGRPRKDAAPGDFLEEQAYEIQRLHMENHLLRDFLHFTDPGSV